MYLQYGVQILTRQFPLPLPSTLLSILLAILTLCLGHALNLVSKTPYFTRAIRRFIADYGMPITVIAVAGLAYWGRLRQGLSVNGIEGGGETTLPVGKGWRPQEGREDWIVKFWELEGKWVGVAFPFGLVLFIVSRLERLGLNETRTRRRLNLFLHAFYSSQLFAFDHNVSSVMAQSTDFPLKKPAGFHWDCSSLFIPFSPPSFF